MYAELEDIKKQNLIPEPSSVKPIGYTMLEYPNQVLTDDNIIIV